jgi:hypothetical protein
MLKVVHLMFKKPGRSTEEFSRQWKCRGVIKAGGGFLSRARYAGRVGYVPYLLDQGGGRIPGLER